MFRAKERNLKLLAKISQSLTLLRNDTRLSFRRTQWECGKSQDPKLD